jgi:hypothetical protein
MAYCAYGSVNLCQTVLVLMQLLSLLFKLEIQRYRLRGFSIPAAVKIGIVPLQILVHAGKAPVYGQTLEVCRSNLFRLVLPFRCPFSFFDAVFQ